MKAVVDTNWLVAAYLVDNDIGRTEIVRRFSQRYDIPLLLSPVVEMEAENVFAALAREANPKEWRQFQADIGMKFVVQAASLDSIALKSRELFRRYSHKARLGTLDMMILASALLAEATHFLSFDTNSSVRALAAVLRN